MERTGAILLKAKPTEGAGESHYIREAIQLAILEVISDDKELADSMVFQGGTALRLCYGLNRLSEDLDFVAGERFISAGEKLAVSVKENLPEIRLKEKQTEHLYILDLKYRGLRVKVEIARVPAYTSCMKKVKSDLFFDIPNIWIKVERLEEILADKIVAMGLRAFSEKLPFKARDIWDIHWLIDRGVKTDISMVLRKVADYKRSLEEFSHGLKRRIELMKKKEAIKPFSAEMERFLYGKDYDLFINHKEDLASALLKEVTEYLEQIFKELKIHYKN